MTRRASSTDAMRLAGFPMIVLIGIAAVALCVQRPSIGRADSPGRHGSYVDGAGEVIELVPRPEVGYRKGRKIALEVVTIGWADVEVGTARAFLAMREAAAAHDIDLAIRSGFRNMEQQLWLYEAWKGGYGNKAARPGRSSHQAGKALDLYLDSAETFAWLEANARRFGFKRTVKGEPWHWEYVKKPAKKKRRRKRR